MIRKLCCGKVLYEACMRFQLVDRITQLELGQSIHAVKSLALAEEYLADHFPSAPVMPGVLMLEGLVQASAWLIRASEDFAHSIVTLQEARGIKYANFVEPGQTLEITAEIQSQTDRETKLKAQGTVQGNVAVSGRLVMARYNLADTNPGDGALDAYCIQQQRQLWRMLRT